MSPLWWAFKRIQIIRDKNIKGLFKTRGEINITLSLFNVSQWCVHALPHIGCCNCDTFIDITQWWFWHSSRPHIKPTRVRKTNTIIHYWRAETCDLISSDTPAAISPELEKSFMSLYLPHLSAGHQSIRSQSDLSPLEPAISRISHDLDASASSRNSADDVYSS